MASDRIFGLVVTIVALAYVASATQIPLSLLSDPVGSRSFPYLIGGVMALCGVVVMLRPDPDPEWPALGTLGALLVTVIMLVAYAYALRPFGFLIPTAIASGVLSYQISQRVLPAVATGLGLSLGLFALFKYGLHLGLVAFPKGWF
ncbi:MAG: tripartite tricarboxylate transporter TctB family protein [Alphaproteobacteria bacterium]|nr:MAG: tripartite tricarboxylate transporter TctB family protein [Alphaproteobacteria bacterium]